MYACILHTEQVRRRYTHTHAAVVRRVSSTILKSVIITYVFRSYLQHIDVFTYKYVPIIYLAYTISLPMSPPHYTQKKDHTNETCTDCRGLFLLFHFTHSFIKLIVYETCFMRTITAASPI